MSQIHRLGRVSLCTLRVLLLDIDLLLQKKTFAEVKAVAEACAVSSIPGVTFQAQLSDRKGNVLQITPGQGTRYLERPRYAVMTNFSPFKGDSEKHPWMGLDRYETAAKMLAAAKEDLDGSACFDILKATAQTVCPTVVSMVYDGMKHTVSWCENQAWDKRYTQELEEV